MKRTYALPALMLTLLLVQCAASHKTAYTIPADYPEARRAELVAALEKGQALYKINCSECHGIFTKGKDNIPNFSTTQLDNYSARFLRKDPKVHTSLKNMSQAQLNEVLTFLRFKKTKKIDSTKIGKVPA